jgi:hypothetical protein
VDVLAIHAATKTIRVGESKVRCTSQHLYVVDERSLFRIQSHPPEDFTTWMEKEWSAWLRNLPKLWDTTGEPAIPWLLPASDLERIEVIFCCNLVVYCDRTLVDQSLNRAAIRFLQENPAFGHLADTDGFIQSKVLPTVDVVTELAGTVFQKIASDYGRRFADPFKDLFRELHRYMKPELVRIPRDREGNNLGRLKAPYHEAIRKEAVLTLLRKIGVEDIEIQRWFAVAE